MRILEGVGTLVQLGGLLARLCKMVGNAILINRGRLFEFNSCTAEIGPKVVQDKLRRM